MIFSNAVKRIAPDSRRGTQLSWNALSTQRIGTRVSFSMRTVFPLVSDAQYAEGVIDENLINSSPGMVFVRLDHPR